jgi:hypothetical protein
MERLDKHVLAATDTHATEEMLEMAFSTRYVLRCYNRDGLELPVQCSAESRAVKISLGGSCEMAASQS